MGQVICLSEYQANNPDNLIRVDSIQNVDLFNNHYTIAYRDEHGNYRHARKIKTHYITEQLRQFGIKINEIS